MTEPDDDFEPYDVKCDRCGVTVSCLDAVPEEGDEWECIPCNDRENARERAKERNWCRACGASVPPRLGEGTCQICDPVGVEENKKKNERSALVPDETRSEDLSRR